MDSTRWQNHVGNDARNTVMTEELPSVSLGSKTYDSLAASLTPGLLIVTIGSIALAYQMQWVSAATLWKLWPISLILAGVSELEAWWRAQ